MPVACAVRPVSIRVQHSVLSKVLILRGRSMNMNAPFDRANMLGRVSSSGARCCAKRGGGRDGAA